MVYLFPHTPTFQREKNGSPLHTLKKRRKNIKKNMTHTGILHTTNPHPIHQQHPQKNNSVIYSLQHIHSHTHTAQQNKKTLVGLPQTSENISHVPSFALID